MSYHFFLKIIFQNVWWLGFEIILLPPLSENVFFETDFLEKIFRYNLI